MRSLRKLISPAVIGCTQETEINYTPGVELVGSLPKEFELSTDYALAICTRAQRPELAERLSGLLCGEATAEVGDFYLGIYKHRMEN